MVGTQERGFQKSERIKVQGGVEGEVGVGGESATKGMRVKVGMRVFVVGLEKSQCETG